MCSRNTLSILTIVAILLAMLSPAPAGPIEDCAEFARFGVPGREGDILCRTGHLLAHDPLTKNPVWVIERLTKEKAISKVVPRYDKFKADPDLLKGRRSELSDYTGAGYDRGHLAPSADMRWDQKAMVECFFLSNIVPQVGEGMNRGIWKDLEEYVRSWAISRGELFVFTGPIYYGGVGKTVGASRVAVPSHLYKIIFDPQRREAIAFTMPNRALDPNDMPVYIVSIRDIEAWTGLDFLSNLDQGTQDAIETMKANKLW